MTIAVKRIDMSVSYAIWSGVGTALIALIGFGWFREPVTALKVASMLLIVLGALGGVVAFGFIGIFIGPPVLAVGLTLLQFWIARTRVAPDTPPPVMPG